MSPLKRWIVPETDETAVAALAEQAGISKILAGILWRRNVRTAADAKIFLNPCDAQSFHDPFLMRDMAKAVARIETAINNNERIVVYGDYDVDGITATSLLVKNLRALGAVTDFYIPDRQKEGYGFNTNALKNIARDWGDLVVSVDCGISSVDEVQTVKDAIDIIITDHHTPGKILPPAVAVIDPHRADCDYPDKNLAGVGVAFKLCQALYKKIRNENFAADLDIVALGTIADIVPLVGENRKIAALGLKNLQQTELVGMKALIAAASLTGKSINAGHVGFGLAPRLNAAGRMGSAKDGVKLLLTDDEKEAAAIAEKLNEENAARQDIERDILTAAEEQLATEKKRERHSIVLAGDNWHGGVIGIVASRLVDRHYLPTIVIGRGDETAHGSCRSIKGLNMYDALYALKDWLVIFGGHEMAAGFTIEKEKIAGFAAAFDEYAKKTLTDDDYIPKITVEFEGLPQEIGIEATEEIEKLEPYGQGNPKPLFGCRNARGSAARAIGKNENHLSFLLKNETESVKMLAWNRAELLPIVETEELDIVYVPQINIWQGKKYLEATAADIAPAASGRIFPDRSVLAATYKFLRAAANESGRIAGDAITLTKMLRARGETISLYTTQLALEIFAELNLIAADENGYTLLPPDGKKNLDDSPLYRRNKISK